ncbi:hypothetical protein HNP84_000056 [Thermocatellispora tengchongensis]|uniref:Uncharacterized protein n=1 Tax=Thermocatellispora tengchongensis TaxID=1073253 RepID=A0A840NS11_9ACTN|nr:hypothetical protein [Thermocatellispora tengchongensis]
MATVAVAALAVLADRAAAIETRHLPVTPRLDIP